MRKCFMDFCGAVQTCFTKYADFQGRAIRSEYWYFVLFQIIIQYSLLLLVVVCDSLAVFEVADTFLLVFQVFILVPNLSAASRRLHDIGASGWSQLWVFSIIGIPVVLYWLASKGNPDSNAYGDPVLPPDTPGAD